MSGIEDIELIIRDLIRLNESIATTFDSRLLCSDWENTRSNLKVLFKRKLELTENLEDSINEFFNIKPNFITKKLKIASFALIPKPFSYELKFNVPRNVDTSSRQYFCYIAMMDRLERQYDVITLQKDGYYILDISQGLNFEKILEGD